MPNRQTLARAAALVLCAAVPCWFLRDFMVDDALVTARVAHHLARGLGYRFNPGGPRADAVTPLGYAPLLAPFAAAGPLAAFRAAKWLGALATLASVALLGAEIAHTGERRGRFAPLALVVLSAPLGAWAVSGMETGIITLLCTLSLGRSRGAPLAAGIAAALRPELLVFALVLAVASAIVRRAPHEGFAALAMAFGPALVVGALRGWLFGRVAPLAVFAKPSDLEHGAVYALGALLGTGLLPLLASIRGYFRLAPHYRALSVALSAHALALVLAGGDWMVLYRLMVPVLPAAWLVATALAEVSESWVTAARVASAAALSAFVFATTGVRARHVGHHRLDLIERAREPLRGARQVAALDIGWLGVATPGDITDLAGITDARIAFLPGGHTSKRISRALLDERRVDTLVLLLAPGERLATPWWTSRFDRAVEARVAAFEGASDYRVEAVLPLGGTEQSYVIVRR